MDSPAGLIKKIKEVFIFIWQQNSLKNLLFFCHEIEISKQFFFTFSKYRISNTLYKKNYKIFIFSQNRNSGLLFFFHILFSY